MRKDPAQSASLQDFRRKGRVLLEAAMTVLLLLQMLYLILSEVWHEAAGSVLIVLFVIHHVINRRWYRALAKGKYNAIRMITVIVDALALLLMLTLALSGMVLSQHVFAFIRPDEWIDEARVSHLIASYWGFFFISFHAGMHMTWLIRGKNIRVMSLLISMYGLISFIRERMFSYMFLRSLYADFDGPFALSILRYASIMFLYMVLGASIRLLVGKQSKTDSFFRRKI